MAVYNAGGFGGIPDIPIEVDDNGIPLGPAVAQAPAEPQLPLGSPPPGPPPVDVTAPNLLEANAPAPAPVAAPTLADAALPDAGAPLAQGQRAGATVSHAGPNVALGETITKRATKMGGREKVEAKHAAQAAQDVAAVNTATAQEAEAIGAQGAAETAKYDAEAAARAQMAQNKADHAADSEKAAVLANQKGQEALADYQQSLAEFRAAKVNPAQLFGAMTGGERLGTMMSAFVHDFLGTKGIKTSAMDIFNRAVEQNINAQVENINNKGKSTEMFRNLWDMTLRQSASEAEAKDRIHGFAYAALEQQLLEGAAKYSSPLAQANAQRAIATLNTQNVERGQRIEASARAAAAQEYQQNVANYYQGQNLAQVKDMNAWTKANSAAQRAENAAAAGAGAAKDLDPLIILDDQGNPMKKAHTTKQADEIREKQGTGRSLMEQIDIVRGLVKEAGEVYDGWGSAMENKAFAQRARGARDRLLADYGKWKSGATISVPEMKRFEKIIALDTWTTEPPTDALYSDLSSDIRRGVQKTVDYQTVDLSARDKELVKQGLITGNTGGYDFSSDLQAENDVLASGQGVKDTAVDAALRSITSPGAFEFTTNKELVNDWRAAGLPGVQTEVQQRGGNHSLVQAAKFKVPNYVQGLSDLADQAMKASVSPAEREAAVKGLWNAATSGDVKDASGHSFQEMAGMSQYYLQKVIDYSKEREDIPDINLNLSTLTRPGESESAGGSY